MLQIKVVSRHSRASGNPGIRRCGNLSEITETQKTGFPPARE